MLSRVRVFVYMCQRGCGSRAEWKVRKPDAKNQQRSRRFYCDDHLPVKYHSERIKLEEERDA